MMPTTTTPGTKTPTLMQLLLQEYQKTHQLIPSPTAGAPTAIEAFVRFAEDWLKANPVAGISYSPSITLRFVDGRHALITDGVVEHEDEAPQPGINIFGGGFRSNQ